MVRKYGTSSYKVSNLGVGGCAFSVGPSPIPKFDAEFEYLKTRLAPVELLGLINLDI